MKLKAQAVPYSSVVGAGVLLTDLATGVAVAQIGLISHGKPLGKKGQEALAAQLVELVNRNDIELPNG